MFKKSISIFSFIIALQAAPMFVHAATATILNPLDGTAVVAPSRAITLPTTPALDALTVFSGMPATVKDEAAAQKSIASQISCWGWNCGKVAADVSTGMKAAVRLAQVLDAGAIKPALKVASGFPPSPSRDAIIGALTTMDGLIEGGTKIVIQANQYLDEVSDTSVSSLGNIANKYLMHVDLVEMLKPYMTKEIEDKIKNGIQALVQVLTANDNLSLQLSQVRRLVDIITKFLTTPTSTLTYDPTINRLAYNPGDEGVTISEKDDFSFLLPNGQKVEFNVDQVAIELVNLVNAYHTESTVMAMTHTAVAGATALASLGGSASGSTGGAGVGAGAGAGAGTGLGLASGSTGGAGAGGAPGSSTGSVA